MKERLRRILLASTERWAPLPPFDLERPRVKAHGELATNLAMQLGKRLRQDPQKIARQIAGALADPEGIIESVSVAGGGFLNFVLKKGVWQESLREIVTEGEGFGRSTEGRGRRALIEFVSANPTGPLHIGNARGGPLGDVIGSLLEALGYEVTREYYVNDVGGQIEKFGASLSQRYLRLLGVEGGSAEGGEYSGPYLDELAEKAVQEFGRSLLKKTASEAPSELSRFGLQKMLEEIRKDLTDMGIEFSNWVSEGQILSEHSPQVVKRLTQLQFLKTAEGALWFAPQDEFLADRECVIKKSDGSYTYFANDIAYHLEKYRRGYDRIINIWGSNHHGHVPRIQGAMKGLGQDPSKIETVLYQYVRVKRGEKAVKMSKRGGAFVTAREVLEEVGRDALRFFLLMRAPESHLDFDLELAKRHSQENPVYYVQYAHARLSSLERKAAEMKIPPPETGSVRLELLDLPEEIELIRMIHEYPDEVARAALRLEPHRIPFYLLELTKLFQAYYTKAKEDPRYRVLSLSKDRVLSADIDTSQAKMYLCGALKLTLSQGLKLLGISAPEVMVQESADGRV